MISQGGPHRVSPCAFPPMRSFTCSVRRGTGTAAGRCPGSRTRPAPRAVGRGPPLRPGDRYRAAAAGKGSRRRALTGIRHRRFPGANPQVVRVHPEAENASTGLLGGVFRQEPPPQAGNRGEGRPAWDCFSPLSPTRSPRASRSKTPNALTATLILTTSTSTILSTDHPLRRRRYPASAPAKRGSYRSRAGVHSPDNSRPRSAPAGQRPRPS